MKTSVKLSSTLTIPKVVIGLWQIADMERNNSTLEVEKTALFLEDYAKAGFCAFDMADHYGSSEIIVGSFKKKFEKKETLQLLTKWVPRPGPINREMVRNAIDTALERTQQKSIDLLQFHAWKYSDPSWLDALFYLKELKEEGIIKNIGVTNFDAHHLRVALASGIPIVSNQVSHSLIDRRALGEMKNVCETFQVKLLAYGTLLGGFLSDRWYGVKAPNLNDLKTWSQMKYFRFIETAGGWDTFQSFLKTVKSIAEKHDTTLANIASRYILESDHVAAVLIGARLGENNHIEAHQEMLQIRFDKDDCIRLEHAIKEFIPIPGNCGDEYRTPPFLTASGDLSHHLENFPPVYKNTSQDNNKEQVYSGTVWEDFAGYSRAVKKGDRILVSGTTATHGKNLIGGEDAAAQTHFVIDKIEAAIESLGGSIKDIIRTRVFVNDIEEWEEVAKAHGIRFKGIDPVNTLVEAKLVGKGYKVEIEAEADLS